MDIHIMDYLYEHYLKYEFILNQCITLCVFTLIAQICTLDTLISRTSNKMSLEKLAMHMII